MTLTVPPHQKQKCLPSIKSTVISGTRFRVLSLQCPPCDFWDGHANPLGDFSRHVSGLQAVSWEGRNTDVRMALDPKGAFGGPESSRQRPSPSQPLCGRLCHRHGPSSPHCGGL